MFRLLAILMLMVSVLPVAAQTDPLNIRIMTFNIWRGGELVDFGQVVAAIQAADADIVGLQEAEGNAPRLAAALGWQHVNERLQIISRFPLIDPPGGDGIYIFAQVSPGQVIALANVHLPSDPYGPYAIRDENAMLEDVIALEESTRLAALEPHLTKLSELVAAGVPVLLTGDFNTPSHLDWTEAAAEAREEIPFVVAWPVTVAAEEAGFVDTYRAANADPVERLGITWTYGYPYPRLNPDERIDRIDLVLAANIDETLSSEIVGPTGSPEADIEIAPFPSDHRGVVSEVRVTPVEPPIFVAADRVVRVGEEIIVHYHAPGGEATDRLAIVSADDEVLMWLPPYEASFFGSVTFNSSTLTPGEYAAVLFGEGDTELSRSLFWVLEREALPTVSTDQTEYPAGASITVSWDNAPGFKWDWLAIYAVGEPDLYNGYYAYAYVDAQPAGTLTFDADLLGEEMLPAGEYEVRLLFDDGYRVLASSSFTVTE